MNIRHGCAVMTEPALPCSSPWKLGEPSLLCIRNVRRAHVCLSIAGVVIEFQMSLQATVRFVRQRDRYRTAMSLIHIGHFVGDDIASPEVSISAVSCNADDNPLSAKVENVVLARASFPSFRAIRLEHKDTRGHQRVRHRSLLPLQPFDNGLSCLACHIGSVFPSHND
jgi:hypothetical protein